MDHKINGNEVIKSFNNQIAGHKHNLKPGSPSSIGLLKCGDDCVLKPITKARKGHTEIAFYQEIWSAKDRIVGQLKFYVPKYYGLITLTLDGQEITFLKLEDLSSGFKKPCIADIKIGAQTWEPNVDQQKRFVEDLKYANTKKAYGISITGYQVFDLLTGQLIKRDKHYGRNLTKETVPNALKEFFNIKFKGSSIVLTYVLKRLGEILSWWHQQKVVNIYASSILILYDAWELEYLYRPNELEMLKDNTITDAHLICDTPLLRVSDFEQPEVSKSPDSNSNQIDSLLDTQIIPSDVNEETSQSNPAPLNNLPSDTEDKEDFPHQSDIPWVRVCMIDFAHVVYPYHPKSDENYIYGLTSLINLIHSL